MPDPSHSPVQRLVGRDIADQGGRRLSQRTLGFERTVDSYLAAGIRPRWMERLMDIEAATRRARRELERAYRRLRAECGEDRAAFSRRWRAVAAEWDFAAVNEQIRIHNEWYPVERDLPIHPRTGEYLPVMGRSYRRDELGPDWVLTEFPA
jgi:hypothetical protein